MFRKQFQWNRVLILLSGVCATSSGCTESLPEGEQAWRDSRLAERLSHIGWVNLSQLVWLEETTVTAGAGSADDIELRAGSEALVFKVKEDLVVVSGETFTSQALDPSLPDSLLESGDYI